MGSGACADVRLWHVDSYVRILKQVVNKDWLVAVGFRALGRRVYRAYGCRVQCLWLGVEFRVYSTIRVIIRVAGSTFKVM